MTNGLEFLILSEENMFVVISTINKTIMRSCLKGLEVMIRSRIFVIMGLACLDEFFSCEI